MASISSSFRLSLLASEDANRSINTTKNQILKSNISINKISRVISSNTKEKERLEFKSSILDARRREASRRKEIEDRIEASKVTTNPTSGFRMIGSSSAGPFQRLLGFLGFLTAGWLVENLPTIIFIGKEFISRVFKVGSLISDFIGDTLNIISNFGTLLTSVVTNIATFDFTDQSGRVKNSFLDLNSSMQSVNDELFQAYKLLTTPLTQSSDTGEEAPPLGEEAPNTLYPQPSTPSSPVGGIHKQALDIIAGPESGGNYNAMNQGTDKNGKILGSGDSNKVIGKALTSMTIGEVIDRQNQRKYPRNAKPDLGIHAAGKYQMIGNTLPGAMQSAGLKPSDQFSPENQDRMGLALMQERGIAPWTSGGSKYSTKERAIVEQARRTPVSTTQPTQSAKPTPTTISTKPTNTSTGLSLIPQSGSGGFIQGGSGNGKDKLYATHFHLDYSSKTNDPSILARIRDVAFHAVKAMFARGSSVYFGNAGIFASKDDATLKSQIAAEQQAHGARSSMAVDIQETNPSVQRTFPSQPGSATKFPFAVGSVYYRGGYGREAEIVGSQGITVSHGASGSSGSDLSGKPAKANLYPTAKSNVEQVITPERKGQTIVVDVPESSPPPQTTVVSPPTEGKKSTGQVDNTYLLNRFIKQKLLLDLAYL
jgi:hypothetical protein